MNGNNGNRNSYAFYWRHPPAAGMTYNQQVLPHDTTMVPKKRKADDAADNMAAVSTNYTAADEQEPTAKKQKIDDDKSWWKAGQEYRFLKLQKKVDIFRMVCDHLKSPGMSIKKALEPFCMSRNAYTEMKKHIRKIEVVIENRPYLLLHCISISEILGIYKNIQGVMNDEKKNEVTKKLETTESFWRSKMEERENDLLSELKAKSCVIEELRRENESLRHQLKLEKKKNSSQCAVKEEELTDDEYIVSRWKESESRNECIVKEEELTDDE